MVHGIKKADCYGADLAYVNYLYKQRLGHRAIINYVSVLKQSMKRLCVPCEAWESNSVKLFIRAISKKPNGIRREESVLSVNELDTLDKHQFTPTPSHTRHFH